MNDPVYAAQRKEGAELVESKICERSGILKENLTWDLDPGFKGRNADFYTLTVAVSKHKKPFHFSHEQLADFPTGRNDTDQIIADIVKWIESPSG